MNDFRRQFLNEAVESLKNLLNDFQSAEAVSAPARRDAFRTLHTIKGTAQTFGFSVSSRLAHELETVLSNEENKSAKSNSLFLEGIALLADSLKRKDFEIPSSFIEKIQNAVPNAGLTPENSIDFSSAIPHELFSQLSVQEKTTLRSAWRNGKNIFCLEVGFALANFADELINLREVLNTSGEIVATLPSAKFNGGGKIGFQILLASAAKSAEIRAIAKGSAAAIIFDSSPDVFSNDAAGVLRQAVKHGKETAAKLGKQVDFQTSADEINLSPEKLKIVFDVLLHLIRNAVDHAVETAGKIEISLRTEENGLRLMVSDDGRGLDLEKIKAKAIKKNLISAGKILTEQEAFDLIFLPEFSTKSDVTDISGRGVGLDAVKFAVEKVGGNINVKTEKEKGATFEIFLPRQ